MQRPAGFFRLTSLATVLATSAVAPLGVSASAFELAAPEGIGSVPWLTSPEKTARATNGKLERDCSEVVRKSRRESYGVTCDSVTFDAAIGGHPVRIKTSFSSKGLVSGTAALKIGEDNVPNNELAAACTDIAEALEKTYGRRIKHKTEVEQDGEESYAWVSLGWRSAQSEVSLFCRYDIAKGTGYSLLTFDHLPYARLREKLLGLGPETE